MNKSITVPIYDSKTFGLIGVTKHCPPVFLRNFIFIIKGMRKFYSHISSIISSLPCGRPVYGMSFGYYDVEIDFEESN